MKPRIYYQKKYDITAAEFDTYMEAVKVMEITLTCSEAKEWLHSVNVPPAQKEMLVELLNPTIRKVVTGTTKLPPAFLPFLVPEEEEQPYALDFWGRRVFWTVDGGAQFNHIFDEWGPDELRIIADWLDYLNSLRKGLAGLSSVDSRNIPVPEPYQNGLPRNNCVRTIMGADENGDPTYINVPG